MLTVLSILAGAAFTYWVSVAMGSLLLDRLRITLFREEERPLAFLTGSALLSLTVFVLCALHVFRLPVVIGLGAGVSYWAWRSHALRRSTRTLDPLGCTWRWLLLLTCAPFAVSYLVFAMAPEISPDGSSYHLGFVSRYAAAGGFVTVRSNMYGYLSQGVELLFLHSFVFGKHSAAAVTHLTFLFALASLIVCYGRRIGRPAAGAAAAAFVFASPVVGVAAAAAYIDVATACTVFGVFYLLEVWDPDRNPNTLLAAGLLAGFAYAAKYTAVLILPFALVFVLVRAKKVKPVLLVAGGSLVMIAPWIARNLILTGNPLSPFLNAWFPNPYIHVQFEREYAEFLRTYDVPNWMDRVWHATVGGFALSGLVGPLFLLAPLGLLAVRYREGRRLTLAGVVMLAAFPLNAGARFLIPALPFVAMLLAIAVTMLPFRTVLLGLLMVAHASASWPYPPLGTLPRYVQEHAWIISRFPWEAALRKQPEDEYRRKYSESFRWARLIEEKVPPGKKVFSTVGVADAYTSREVMLWFQSAQNESLRDILLVGYDPGFQPRHSWRYQFPAIEGKKIRVEQTATVPGSQWSVSEVRVFREQAELPRVNQWRLTAHPYPWDIPLAFDNSDVTRWRSWQIAAPGMYLELDFGKPETITEVRLETSPDNGYCNMVLSVFDGSTWKTVGSPPKMQERIPSGWMRRMAAEELRLRGVDYLFLTPDDWPGKDITATPDEWGLTLIGEELGARLYRIEPAPASKQQ